MHDIIIIGKGPAGIQASIYAKRAGMNVIVIGKGYGSLEKAEKVENFFGQQTPPTGKELVEKGWDQAKQLGIEIITDEVVGIEYEGFCRVLCADKTYEASAVIIATGNSRKKANINRTDKLEGKGVSYCAVCDAFFYRGKTVAVLGNGSYAAHEAEVLKNVAENVYILTNGDSFNAEIPAGVKVNTKAIKQLQGEEKLEAVVFEDGGNLELQGFFVAIGSAGATELARKIGLETDGNSIKVDSNMATAVPGIFAAGDCTGGTMQISHAVAKGCTAALKASDYVKKLKK